MDYAKKVKWIIIILFVAAAILFVNPIKDAGVILTVSIGLLAIVIIFVPLVVEKQAAEKLNSYLRKIWVDKKNFFLENTSLISKELDKSDKSKVDYRKIQTAAETLSEIIDSIGLHKEDLQYALRYASSLFITVIVITLVDVGLGSPTFRATPEANPLSLSMIYSPILIFGIYYCIKIILIWFEITQKK